MKWVSFDGPNYHIKENSELLPADLVEAMKRMNPPPIFSSQKKCKHKDGNANSGSCFLEHKISWLSGRF